MYKTKVINARYKLSTLLFCFSMVLLSCTEKSLSIASDREFAYEITETYNAKYTNPLLRLIKYKNVYKNIIQSHANVLISNSIPQENIEENFLYIHIPKNVKNIVHIKNKKTVLLAFSLPLIVTLKSSHIPMPSNGMLSFSELRAQIHKIPINASKNIWSFPLKPHENFKQIFPNDQAYEEWMQSITKNITNTTETFARRYDTIPFLAILKDRSIAYKFIPSHLFFSQPFAFRNLFSVALLTDDKNMTPIVAPIFISTVKRESFSKNHSAKKLIQWLLKTSTHNEIIAFSHKIFKYAPLKTQFLGRSYSNNAHFTSNNILPRNSWLAHHAPPYSSLYFARSK